MASDSVVDDVNQPVERAAADEQDVRGVNLNEVLIRMFAAALRGDVCNCSLDYLQ